MIAYLDSSVLVRAYLADDDGHEEAVDLMTNLDITLVTGSLTLVEVSGALVRAARRKRGRERDLLMLLDSDVSDEGPVTVVRAERAAVEAESLALVRTHGIRALDAWHLATAALCLPELAERGEGTGFASRDRDQAAVARSLGLQLV